MAVLDLYMKEISYKEYEQIQATTWTETLSDIGGNMGLFLGMSAVPDALLSFPPPLPPPLPTSPPPDHRRRGRRLPPQSCLGSWFQGPAPVPHPQATALPSNQPPTFT